MNILLFPDVLDDWSAHNRAKQLQSHLGAIGHKVQIENGQDTLRERKDRIPDLFKEFDVIHFLYSSCIHEWLDVIREWRGKRILVGSAIGHRWWSGADDSLNAIETKQAIEAMKMMNHVVALSPALETLCHKVGIDRVTHIPNGVDKDMFSPRPLRIGHVGPINEGAVGDYKGGHMVVEACKKLGEGYEFVHGGQYKLKHRPFKEMPDFYRDIDVLVQPSTGEGCSNPVMEALSMNVRVVATREAVIETLWPYVIFCIRDINDICDKIATTRMIRPWAEIAGRYHELYRGLAEGLAG